MLHSSSSHYYACYYALLCLLYHQQQALAVTIVIDGARTNEWATKDEYQSLVDSSQGPHNNQGNSFRNPTSSSSSSQSSSSSSASPSSSQSQSSASPSAAAASAAALLNDRGELQLALDRLDLIERERKLQVKQLKQLDSLERAAETGVAFALSHQVGGQQFGEGYDGPLRALSELVPPTDADLLDQQNPIVRFTLEGPSRRETLETPRKFCGDNLKDMLDMVCNQRFVSSEVPEISEPKIKMKRSVDYITDNVSDDDELSLMVADSQATNNVGAAAAGRGDGSSLFETGGNGNEGGSGGGGSAMPILSPRRKLRTLQTTSRYEGDGEPSHPQLSSLSSSLSSSSPVHNGNIGNNHNHNHEEKQQQQRYLSKFNFDTNNNINNLNTNINNNNNSQNRRAKPRRIRGVVGDCCKNSCLMSDLKKYCAS